MYYKYFILFHTFNRIYVSLLFRKGVFDSRMPNSGIPDSGIPSAYCAGNAILSGCCN